MKNTWKKTLAGLMALTLVAGVTPANVGGFLTGSNGIVAHAEDVDALTVTWADEEETHEFDYFTAHDPNAFSAEDFIVSDGEDAIEDFVIGEATFDYPEGSTTGTGTIEIKEVKKRNDQTNVPEEFGKTGFVTFTVVPYEVSTFEDVDYYLEGAKDENGIILDYDGLRKTPSLTRLIISGIDSDDDTGFEGYRCEDITADEYSVTYANNINAGNPSDNPKKAPQIQITFNGKRFSGRYGGLFTISQASAYDFNIKPECYIYNGGLKIASFDCGIEGSSLRFKSVEDGWYVPVYSDEDNTEIISYEKVDEETEGAVYSTSRATDAGEYTAIIEATELRNCTGRRAVKWSIVDISAAKTYDGEAIDLDDFSINGLLGEQKNENGEVVDEFAGYRTPKENPDEELNPVNIVYYSYGENNEVSETPLTSAPVNAGKYRAVVTITDLREGIEEADKNPTVVKTFDVTIAKKAITVAPAVTSKSYLFPVPSTLGIIDDDTKTTEENDGIVAADRETLGKKNLFKLTVAEGTSDVEITKTSPVGSKCSITFDESIKAEFDKNYELTYDPVEFSVVQRSISDAVIEFEEPQYTYDGTVKKPTITVKFPTEFDDAGSPLYKSIQATDPDTGALLFDNTGDKPVPVWKKEAKFETLTLDTDYTIDTEHSTTSATDAGEYTVTIKGKGNYDSQTNKQANWTIEARDIADYINKTSKEGTTDAVTVNNPTYQTNTEQKPTITIKNLTEAESADSNGDFIVEVTPKTDAGDYTFTVKGNKNYKGEWTQGKWSVLKADAEVQITSSKKTYDGEDADIEDIVYSAFPEDFGQPNVTVEFYAYGELEVEGEAGPTQEELAAIIKNETPLEAGSITDSNSYIAKLTAPCSADKKNYNDFEKLAVFTIEKRKAELSPILGQSKQFHTDASPIQFEFEKMNGSRGFIEADTKKAPETIDDESYAWVDFLYITKKDEDGENDPFFEMEKDTPAGTYYIAQNEFVPDLVNYEIECSYETEYMVTPRSLSEHATFVLKPGEESGTFIDDSDKPNTFVFDGKNKSVVVDYAYDKDWEYDGDDATIENVPEGYVAVKETDSAETKYCKKITEDDYIPAGVMQMAYPGQYALQADGKGNYEGKLTTGNGLDWTIEEADADIHVALNEEYAESNGKVYDGKPMNNDDFTLTAAEGYPMKKAKITYTYYKVDGTGIGVDGDEVYGITDETVPLDGAPKDAGSYVLVVKASRKGYSDDQSAVQFTISKKTVNVVLGEYDASVVYGNALPTIEDYTADGIIEGEDLGLTVNYAICKKTVTTDEETGIQTTTYDALPDDGWADAGAYTIHGTPVITNKEAAANYDIVVDDSAFVIEKKDIEDDEIEVKELILSIVNDNGVTLVPKESIAPVYTPSAENADNNKSLELDKDYTINAPNGVLTKGDYSIELVGKGNYTGIRAIDWLSIENKADAEGYDVDQDELDALFADKESAVDEIKAAIEEFSISDPYIKKEGKVTVNISRKVVSDKPNIKIVETGVLLFKNESNHPELTLENAENGLITKGKTNTISSGTFTCNIADNGGENGESQGVAARGYIIVTDGTFNYTMYTDTIEANYADVKSNKYFINKIDKATQFDIEAAYNSTKKTGCVKIHREVAEDYEIIQTGVLLVKDKASELELKVIPIADADYDTAKYSSKNYEYVPSESGVTMGVTNNIKSGTYTANISEINNSGFIACGYIVVKDSKGNILVKYTDTEKTSKAELEPNANN